VPNGRESASPIHASRAHVSNETMRSEIEEKRIFFIVCPPHRSPSNSALFFTLVLIAAYNHTTCIHIKRPYSPFLHSSCPSLHTLIYSNQPTHYLTAPLPTTTTPSIPSSNIIKKKPSHELNRSIHPRPQQPTQLCRPLWPCSWEPSRDELSTHRPSRSLHRVDKHRNHPVFKSPRQKTFAHRHPDRWSYYCCCHCLPCCDQRCRSCKETGRRRRPQS